MLVSAIGYFNSYSKSLYGADMSRAQGAKSNLNEVFGQVGMSSGASLTSKSNILGNVLNSVKTLFNSTKADDSQKYLSLIA